MPERRLPGERLAGELATAVLRNIDADQLARGVDLEELLLRVDLDDVLTRVDVDALLARIDVNALLARVDVDALVARIDVDALSRRIPVGELVSTADIQAAVDGVDLGPALRRAGLADIVAQSVGRSTLDTVRRRVVVIDALASRLTGTVLRRPIDDWPAGPHALVGDETGPLGRLEAEQDGDEAWDVAGHFVGPLGRILTTTLDITGAISSWSFVTTIVLTLLGRAFGLEVGILGADGDLDASGSVGFLVGLVLWFAAWFLLPLEVVGRTPAMSLLGARVVTTEGEVPGFRRLFWRSVVQVPSAGLLGLGYVLTFIDPRRRALHDRIAGTSVVWDWGGRAATIASPLGRWVAGD